MCLLAIAPADQEVRLVMFLECGELLQIRTDYRSAERHTQVKCRYKEMRDLGL